jgi:hypothetical protein
MKQSPAKTPASTQRRINLSGNRVVIVETKDVSDRGEKDIIGSCVSNSQDPVALLANLKRIPGVISAQYR